jgi:hypothetical protein
MQWKKFVWTIQRAFCEQWSGSFCELLRILIYTLFLIIVTFEFFLTVYNFRIRGCNCNHIDKVMAPLQHHARVSRPDNVLYLKAICTPASKLKQTNICTTHNVSFCFTSMQRTMLLLFYLQQIIIAQR